MALRSQSLTRVVVKSTLLLLVFSVFCWALQAKLAMYKTSRDARHMAAKLSTDKNTDQTMELLRQQAGPASVWERAGAGPAAVPMPLMAMRSAGEQPEIDRRKPDRHDPHYFYRLHLPPPSLT